MPESRNGEQSSGEPLDNGERTFAKDGAIVRGIQPGDTWIIVKHRGGSLMMSVDEVDNVVEVICAARDWSRSDLRTETRGRCETCGLRRVRTPVAGHLICDDCYREFVEWRRGKKVYEEAQAGAGE